MKTSELIGPALDWAVGRCVGRVVTKYNYDTPYTPSTDWSQGGPIIERERISLSIKHDGWWLAQIYNINDDPRWLTLGQTPLIAAMRCYVASKLGDEVEIPEELK